MAVAQYKPSTKKVYDEARRSFENLMGKKAEDATTPDIEIWLHNLRAIGRPTSTCRTYLSAINHIAGLKVRPRGLKALTLPSPNGRRERVVLSREQIKKMLFAMNCQDRLLFLAVLVYGPSVRVWTWAWVMENGLDLPLTIWNEIKEFLKKRGLGILPLVHGRKFHWVNGVPLQEAVFHSQTLSSPLTPQEVNRRLKRYARQAGISEISMRVWVRSGKAMLEQHEGNQEAALEALGLSAKISTAGMARPSVNGQVDRPSENRRVNDPRLHGIGRRVPSS